MSKHWGYTLTETARDADSITYNVKVSPLRLVVDVVRATKPRHVPLMLALLAVATIRARWRDAIALVGLAVWLAFVVGCPMPAPDGCSPGARRCHEDTPQVCSPGQRWTPADVTCSTVNASCIVRDGVPACLRGEQ